MEAEVPKSKELAPPDGEGVEAAANAVELLGGYAGRTDLSVDRIANADFRAHLPTWALHTVGTGAFGVLALLGTPALEAALGGTAPWVTGALLAGWVLLGIGLAADHLAGIPAQGPAHRLQRWARRLPETTTLVLLVVGSLGLATRVLPAGVLLVDWLLVLVGVWSFVALPLATAERLLLGASLPVALGAGYRRSAQGLWRRLRRPGYPGLRPPHGEARLLIQPFFGVLIVYLAMVVALLPGALVAGRSGLVGDLLLALPGILVAGSMGLGADLALTQWTAHYMVYLGQRRQAGEPLSLPGSPPPEPVGEPHPD